MLTGATKVIETSTTLLADLAMVISSKEKPVLSRNVMNVAEYESTYRWRIARDSEGIQTSVAKWLRIWNFCCAHAIEIH